MSKKRGDIIAHSTTINDHEEQPAWMQERLDWFMDQRFGMFIHWGPYSQWDCLESWPLVPEDTWARPDGLDCWEERGRDLARFSRDYKALNTTFNPTEFDPDAWAELALQAGMRYLTFTTKHHDGFCLFDTKTTDYRSTHPSCPFHDNPRADITREVFTAFQKRNLAISCYFSKSDWDSPFYWSPEVPVVDRNPNYDTQVDKERWQNFVDFTHRQVEELMTKYGKIDTLWLDGGQVQPPAQDLQMGKMVAMARKHQPGLLVADRTVGGKYENFISPEQQIPEIPLNAPWESCLTLGRAWKYVSDDSYKSPQEIIRMLIETTALGGNLLLGFGPDPLGRIPEEAQSVLRAVGSWLQINGEAIYGTRPLDPFLPGPTRYTTKGQYTYVFLPAATRDKTAPEGTESTTKIIPGICPAAGTTVEILGATPALKWQSHDDGFQVDLPTTLLAEKMPPVIRLTQRAADLG